MSRRRRKRRTWIERLMHSLDVLAFGRDYKKHPQQDSRKSIGRKDSKKTAQVSDPRSSSRGRGVHLEDLPAAIQRQILGRG